MQPEYLEAIQAIEQRLHLLETDASLVDNPRIHLTSRGHKVHLCCEATEHCPTN